MRNLKKPMRIVSIIRFIFPIYLLLFLIVTSCSRTQPRDLTKRLGKERIHAYNEKRTYFSEISDYAVLEDRLYVLYGRIGVMEVFGTDGSYEKSYVVFCGISSNLELNSDGTAIWMTGNDDNCYLFQNGSMIEEKALNEYYSAQYGGTFISKKAMHLATDGSVYKRKGASICRVTATGLSEIIVHRPIFCLFVQGLLPFLLHIFVMIGSAIILYTQSRIHAIRGQSDNQSIRGRFQCH